MAAPNIDDLLALDVETRLALIQKLWDSIVEDSQDPTALPLSAEQRALLQRRLQEDDDDPGAAIPWADARDALRRDR